MNELQVAYLGIEVPDPSSLAAFFGEIIGLSTGASAPDGSLTWTDDAAAHRVIVQPGPADDAAFVGFEAVDDAAFDAIAARLEAAGHPLTPGTDDELAHRRVARLGHTVAPWGTRIELVSGLERLSPAPVSDLIPGGFFTEGVGFGHVVFAALDLDAAHRFVTDGLGMGRSDWVETEIAPGIELEIRFYHCNPRHHTVALAGVPFEMPQKLHHLMVETNDRDDVGRAFDRAFEAGLPIANGLGRHENDGMFSFYVVSPAGFQVEVGHGARTVGPDWDDDRRYTRISIWGHQPIQRP